MIMKKIYALIAAIIVLAAASVAVIVNADNSESLFEANVEALANYETGCDCHYVNGYTPCGRRCSSI